MYHNYGGITRRMLDCGIQCLLGDIVMKTLVYCLFVFIMKSVWWFLFLAQSTLVQFQNDIKVHEILCHGKQVYISSAEDLV